MNRPANIQLDAATLRRVDELAQTTSRARDSLIEEALDATLTTRSGLSPRWRRVSPRPITAHWWTTTPLLQMCGRGSLSDGRESPVDRPRAQGVR